MLHASGDTTRQTLARSPERLKAHYLVEVELADRLRASVKEERATLYQSVYDELYRRLPDHPQVTRRGDAGGSARAIATQVKLLSRFLSDDQVFMEIGAGDCSLTVEVARRVKHAYALDASAEITRGHDAPTNLEVLICNGTESPVAPGSIDVAFTHQVIEHMHVDDARDHARSVLRALRPGGVYICVTPHAMNGPHDISKYFGSVARGLHMKEYTNGELIRLFSSVGFSRIAPLVGLRGHYALAPARLVTAAERALSRFPKPAQRRLASRTPFRQLLGIALMATK